MDAWAIQMALLTFTQSTFSFKYDLFHSGGQWLSTMLINKRGNQRSTVFTQNNTFVYLLLYKVIIWLRKGV